MLDPNSINSPIAIVGIAAIMPQAPDAATFWANIREGRYSVTDVPPARWDPALYFSEDHGEPDKTYSKIGGWVREFPWDPIRWKLPIPPKVAEQLDEGQRWAVSAARSALLDAGSAQVASLLATIPHDAIRAAQAGLLADMDRVADVLYGRTP